MGIFSKPPKIDFNIWGAGAIKSCDSFKGSLEALGKWIDFAKDSNTNSSELGGAGSKGSTLYVSYKEIYNRAGTEMEMWKMNFPEQGQIRNVAQARPFIRRLMIASLLESIATSQDKAFLLGVVAIKETLNQKNSSEIGKSWNLAVEEYNFGKGLIQRSESDHFFANVDSATGGQIKQHESGLQWSQGLRNKETKEILDIISNLGPIISWIEGSGDAPNFDNI